MVGDSQQRPDRNRRAPEARARGRSAPNIILITRGCDLDEWPPAQSLSGAADLFHRRWRRGGGPPPLRRPFHAGIIPPIDNALLPPSGDPPPGLRSPLPR